MSKREQDIAERKARIARFKRARDAVVTAAKALTDERGVWILGAAAFLQRLEKLEDNLNDAIARAEAMLAKKTRSK